MTRLEFAFQSISQPNHNIIDIPRDNYIPFLKKIDTYYPPITENNKTDLTEYSKLILFGRELTKNKTLAIHILYEPFCYIKYDALSNFESCMNQITTSLPFSYHPFKNTPLYSVEHYSYKQILGYTRQPDHIAKIRFRNDRVLNDYVLALYNLHEKNQYKDIQAFEHGYNFKHTHKFLDDCNIHYGQYLYVPLDKCVRLTTKSTCCDIETQVMYTDIQPLDYKGPPPHLMIASFDIECYSSNPNIFPEPSILENCIIGIGTSIKNINDSKSPTRRVYFGLHGIQSKDSQDIEIYTFESELDMLLSWKNFICIDVNPDIITGYNINKFDWYYIHERLKCLSKKKHHFEFLSRIWSVPTPIQKKTTKYADIIIPVNVHGRLLCDLLEYVRQNQKLSVYKLDVVCTQFLNCPTCRNNNQDKQNCTTCHGSGKYNKLDLSPKQLFEYFQGSDEQRGKIAEYCIRDCDLVLELITKLVVIRNILEMATITITHPQDIILKGQQCKVFNQLIWYAHRNQYYINSHDPPRKLKNSAWVRKDDDHDTGYQGATVIEPMMGYYEEPITVLDFASLYPSIIRTHNLCPSTWIQSEKDLQGLKENIDYKKIVTNNGTHYFIQTNPGILPKILATLLQERSTIKKMMESEQDPFLKSVMDAKQLAVKVSANSVYGFFGVQSGMFPCIPVSDATTYFGRKMIEQLKNTIMQKYEKSQVIYGDTDSVMILLSIPPEHASSKMDKIKYCFQMGTIISKMATDMFGGFIKLTMEKVYDGFIMLRKKKYSGLAYMNLHDPPIIINKGVEAERRDAGILVSQTYKQIIHYLLEKRDQPAAIQYLKDVLEKMVQRTLPMEYYVLTTSLKHSYKNEETMIPCQVVQKIKARNPGSEPQYGERFEYVMIAPKEYSQKRKGYVADYAEEYKYALANQLPIDTSYYLDKLYTPMESLLGKDQISGLFKYAYDKVEQQNAQRHFKSMDSFVTRTAVQTKKSPTVVPDARKRANTTYNTTSLLNMFQKKSKNE